MSTKTYFQALIISGPDVTHYGNPERPRKKRRGLFGLNKQEICIGSLVGLVEQSIHQKLVTWAIGVLQAIGFGTGLATWSAGAFCIALACMITSWCGSSILSKKKYLRGRACGSG